MFRWVSGGWSSPLASSNRRRAARAIQVGSSSFRKRRRRKLRQIQRREFRFLKDPVFLASSVFVKKPERVIALSFVMVLCLLVYRLAEHLLRRQLVATQQTVPNQINKPTNHPTMRWIFHCFEGIDLLYIRMGSHWHTQVLGLQALHQQVLRLLGPAYSQFYFFSP